MINMNTLGALLYVPATQKKLKNIIAGEELVGCNSIVICTEDSVSDRDLYDALRNLENALPLADNTTRKIFIRPRSPFVLGKILAMKNIANIDGFVLPKISRENLSRYLDCFHQNSIHSIMLTIEDEWAFDINELLNLEKLINESKCRNNVIGLRIGGCDLLSTLKIRRPRDISIYETPIRMVINNMAAVFITRGYCVSAPVFEHIDDLDTLRKELQEDLNHGLIGKTAIHPDQVSIINNAYRVSKPDLADARDILEPDAKGVFKRNGSMLEPATHKNWAEDIVKRAEIYGTC
ncbi:MAG: HpcH/HpaI aldolase/citrate lyase family protein [Flavobacteriales bacterium]|nr:HpcH/HpaI aldolase/citrate lyase family protein [Flavobacteriales bacterium]